MSLEPHTTVTSETAEYIFSTSNLHLHQWCVARDQERLMNNHPKLYE